MAVLVDTNILVRVRQAVNPHQAVCRQVLELNTVTRLKLCVCAQTIIEYWVVATRPVAQNGGGLTPAEAGADSPGAAGRPRFRGERGRPRMFGGRRVVGESSAGAVRPGTEARLRPFGQPRATPGGR